LNQIPRIPVLFFYPFFQDEIAIPERKSSLADLFAKAAAQALERAVGFVCSDLLTRKPGLGHPQLGSAGDQLVAGQEICGAGRHARTARRAAQGGLHKQLDTFLYLWRRDVPSGIVRRLSNPSCGAKHWGKDARQPERRLENRRAEEQARQVEEPGTDPEELVGIEKLIRIRLLLSAEEPAPVLDRIRAG
jgi:hypothetical protein